MLPTTESIIHTVLGSEVEAFTHHVNTVLRGDPDISGRLPIKPAEIFDAVMDGVIFCKLINEAVPGKVPPISPEAINMNPTNIYQKIQNLYLTIESARAIGCTVVNLQPQFLLEKREHLVLGLIWQIIKIHIENSFNIKKHPEIELLRKEDEPLDIMQKLGFEEILIRWLNYHIRKNKEERKIKNLGSDLADSFAYGHVLQNVINNFNKSFWGLTKEQKAVDVISMCEKEGMVTSVRPHGITSGNPRLNTLLCVEIFNWRHGLTYPKKEEVIVPKPVVVIPPPPLPEIETDETREMRIFKNWINSQGLPDVYVNYLIDDLRNGHVLLKVIDHLRPKSVDWENKYSNKLHSRIHIVQNCNYVLEICKALNVKLVNIGGVDIVDGNIIITLGLVWQLCKLYWEERVGVINDEQILEWGNSRVGNEFRIKSFKDKSLKSCMFLLNIIESIQPKIVDFTKVQSGEAEANRISRMNYTISLARKLGCEVITLWEHLNQCNVRYVPLLVAELQRVAKIARK